MGKFAWHPMALAKPHQHERRPNGFGALVGAFLNRKEARNGFKWKVMVPRAHFLNSGLVPSSFGVMARFFSSKKNLQVYSANHLHLRTARSPNPTIISTPPRACTCYMMFRTHVQEGMPTKNLQHPQNTQALVSYIAKLAVLAPFTP